MYTIERRPSGFLLTFGGFIAADEMQNWYNDSLAELKSAPPAFGVIIDMRMLRPLPPDAQAIIISGQQAYKAKGMQRSCVIVANAITKNQFLRLAKDSGIYAFERYLDADSTPDWQSKAVAWVKNGIDPDLIHKKAS
jgi:hypothetical protein